MHYEIEQLFIKKFVIKNKQERFLNFLGNKKTRIKFTNELYHFKYLVGSLIREIKGNESEAAAILSKIQDKKDIVSCYVISVNSKFDGKLLSINEAIENLVGEEGSILVFGDAEVIYYEGEAPGRRYISI